MKTNSHLAEFTFYVFDEKLKINTEKKVSQSQLTEFQKKFIKSHKENESCVSKNTPAIVCGTYEECAIEERDKQFIIKYLFKTIPKYVWLTYEEMLELFLNQIDREIVRFYVEEKNYSLGLFVDRKECGDEKKVIKYRITPLSSVEREISKVNTDTRFVKESAKDFKDIQEIRELLLDFGYFKYYFDNRAVFFRFFIYVTEEPRSFEKIYSSFTEEDKKIISNIIPEVPSLTVYREILRAAYELLQHGFFISYWYDKKEKTFYFQRTILPRCNICNKPYFVEQSSKQNDGKSIVKCEKGHSPLRNTS